MDSKTQKSRVLNQLEGFGCTTKEAAIYLQCFELGQCSVQEIAKRLRINRVTVHSAAERLIEKGLLVESRKGKRRVLVAEPPSVFQRILQRDENEVQARRGKLTDLVSLLEAFPRSGGSIPTVRFLEGPEGFKKMLEETLTARGECLVFTYVDLFAKLLDPLYLEDYFRRRAGKGINTRLIFPPCPFAEKVAAKAAEYRIKVRLMPPEIKWRAGIFSWNNSLALQSFTQGQITCTIIENDDLAHFYRTILFELSWQQAKLFTER